MMAAYVDAMSYEISGSFSSPTVCCQLFVLWVCNISLTPSLPRHKFVWASLLRWASHRGPIC